MITRRGFLGTAAALLAGALLGLRGVTGRVARRVFRIPVKPLDRAALRGPNDLAG